MQGAQEGKVGNPTQRRPHRIQVFEAVHGKLPPTQDTLDIRWRERGPTAPRPVPLVLIHERLVRIGEDFHAGPTRFPLLGRRLKRLGLLGGLVVVLMLLVLRVGGGIVD